MPWTTGFIYSHSGMFDFTFGACVETIGTCNCPAVIDPVCGEDGMTYNNLCEAECKYVLLITNRCV